MERVVKVEKGAMANRVFRLVASARRPLKLDEIREAIAITPGQTFRNQDRLINDTNRLIAWCGNLIVLDEEEQVIHFTHFSVKQFFLSDAGSPSLSNFHFRLSQANHDLGEICVTYLSFKDFKRRLIQAPKVRPPLDPELILKASLAAGLNKPMSGSWVKFARIWRAKKLKEYDLVRQLRDEAGLEDLDSFYRLQSTYPFLTYASEFWLLHTDEFETNYTIVWSLWRNLLHAEDTVAQLPWTREEWTDCAENVRQWIFNHNHCALLQLITEETPIDLRLTWMNGFLVNAASGGRLALLNIIRKTEYFSKLDLDKAFHAASAAGHLNAVELFLAANVVVDGPGNGSTALQAAASGGHINVVKTLLINDADVNAVGQCQAALQGAARHGHLELLDILIAAGAEFNAPACENGRTALQAAAESGHFDVVMRLLDLKADINAAPSSYKGRTALQAAAEMGHLELTTTLLLANADVNSDPASSDGRRALEAAAGNGYLEIAEMLLEAGADINAEPVSIRGRTALQAAAEGGHLKMVEMLLAAKANPNAPPAMTGGRTAVQAAAAGGHFSVLKRLLGAKADINAASALCNGRTALQAAAEMGSSSMVKSLLAAKADVNAMPSKSRGRTALEAAAGGGHMKIVERLLGAGAQVDASTNPLDYFTHQIRTEGTHNILPVVPIPEPQEHIRNDATNQQTINALLGISSLPPTQQTPPPLEGHTALQSAASHGYLQIVSRLLIAGANPNIISKHHPTPLQAAIEGGYTEIVAKLLKAGVVS